MSGFIFSTYTILRRAKARIFPIEIWSETSFASFYQDIQIEMEIIRGGDKKMVAGGRCRVYSIYYQTNVFGGMKITRIASFPFHSHQDLLFFAINAPFFRWEIFHQRAILFLPEITRVFSIPFHFCSR